VVSRGPAGSDFAVLNLPYYRFDSFELEPMPVAAEAPEPGDELTLLGYGCTGELERRRLRAGPELGLADGCACHGDSGGPLVNARGELAGTFVGWVGDVGTGLRYSAVTRQAP
jgi:hypothetical protein